jgi:osmotically-inducible protein OsmY
MKSDLQLTEEVLSRLELEPKIDPRKLGIFVENGIVTLRGNVEDEEDRTAAWRAVRFIKGVKGVMADELRVNSAQPAPVKDTDIRAAAEEAIQWLTTVPRETIKVIAQDGWLTLEGTVETAYQAQFVEGVLSEVPGVRGVKNGLTVVVEKKAA